MSNWSSTQLTDLGRALDAKVTAGTTLLSFTKMKLGSGTETAEDIPAMTDLVSPKLVLGISSCAVSASDDTICELISVASSSDVEDSFVVRELGVFATDPDVGEILYAVMLDSTPDTMPNKNVSSPVTVTYQVNIVSDNASSITAVIDPAGLVTASVLQAHNDSISAHKMAHWYRQNSKVYAVGDIAFSASLPSSLVLECTTAGTTASTAPDFSGAVEGGTVTDGTVVWTYKTLVGEDGANPDLSNLTATGEDHFLERDFTIIYPNGGSASSPANVTNNSRYVETNPFPGYIVNCIAEIKFDNKWGCPAWYSIANDGRGIGVHQLNDDSIVVQTGNNHVMTASSFESGDPFGHAGVSISSAPCRVKVWKIGKVGGNA